MTERPTLLRGGPDDRTDYERGSRVFDQIGGFCIGVAFAALFWLITTGDPSDRASRLRSLYDGFWSHVVFTTPALAADLGAAPSFEIDHE